MAGTILIVEDDAPMRALLATLVEAKGFGAIAVSSGEEALAGISGERPDLVILDLRLPGIDGFETLKRLRDDLATAAVPVLVLTASVDADDLIRAYAGGASYYVIKPFRPDELMRGLGMALAERPARASP